MTTWNEKCNFCDSEETLEDYFNQIMRRVTWYMFDHQQDWLIMASRDEEGHFVNPKVKSFELLEETFMNALRDELGWAAAVMLEGYITSLIEDDIDIDDDTRWWYKDYNGLLKWDDEEGYWKEEDDG